MTKLTVALDEINMHLNRIVDAVHLLGYSKDIDHFKEVIKEGVDNIRGIVDYQIKCSIIRDEPISIAKFMNVDTTMAEVNRGLAELEKGEET